MGGEMKRASDTGRIPDLLLERYRLGEVVGPDRERMERLLAVDESLRARLAELERSDAEIRKQYPAEWLADRVRDRLRQKSVLDSARPPRAWIARWPVPAAVAAAAGVLLMLAPRVVGPPPAGPGVTPSFAPGDRVKGLTPALNLYRKTAEGGEALAEGSIVRAGDVLRIGYRSAGRSYGVILSIDGGGGVTLHLPAAGRRAVPLQAGGVVLLDHAYELDDAPRWECFYFVTSATPFDAAAVLDDARRAAATDMAGAPPRLALPAGLEQSPFFLRKGQRP
jgi:hypothetical protein